MDAPERSGGSDSSQKRGDVHFWNLRRLPDARKTDCGPARRGDGRCDPGMGLLPVTTELGEQKVRTRVGGEILGGMLDGCELSGYEIHMGISRPEGTANLLQDPRRDYREGAHGRRLCGNVCGTYVHGIFDHGSIAGKIVRHLAERKGLVLGEDGVDYGLFKEQQYDKLAATLRKYLDLDAIYKMMREYE